jgi:hypothetical protein
MKKTNKDIGFLMPVVDNNFESNSICTTISKLIHARPNDQICIFNSYCEKIDTYNIPVLHVNQAKFFKGSLVVFDLQCLELSRSLPLLDNVYYYAKNIPWTNTKGYYEQWKNLFSKPNIKVISSNKYIDNIYNIVWSNSIGISENFDYDTISNIIR